MHNDNFKNNHYTDVFHALPLPLKINPQFSAFESQSNIVFQGMKIEDILILLKGRVSVLKMSIDGGETTLSIIEPGFICGDVEYFSDGANCALASIKAIEKSEFLKISFSKLDYILSLNPEVMHFFCKELSNKLQASSTLNTLNSVNSEIKVKHYLSTCLISGKNEINLDSREIIASKIGISVRQVNRALKSLHEKNIIFVKNKNVKIINLTLLISEKKLG